MKNLENIRIFIVDDQPVFLKLLKGLVRPLGYTQITLLESAEDCVANLNLYPDIVFIDYNMTGMNGIELLKKVKEFSDTIVVVFTSGSEDIRLAMEAIKLGAFDFLLKSNVNRKEVAALFEKINIAEKISANDLPCFRPPIKLNFGF